MLLAIVLLATLISGCKGKSVKEDNPVFTAAPPRNSLVNDAADAEELRLVQLSTPDGVVPVAYHEMGVTPLAGSSIVATVNGKPVFVDDVLGGVRRKIESDPNLSNEQRQIILAESLRRRTADYCQDELVIQALEATIPEDKRKLIRDSLEPAFQDIRKKMMKDNGIATDTDLDQWLAEQGFTAREMKDTFVRRQFIEGYIQSKMQTPKQIDRAVLVDYYQSHINDYTPDEEVRFAEIVVKFRAHGGREGAEEVMTTVVQRLQKGEDFGAIARDSSDALSGEKRGDIGWIKRGSLKDKNLEMMLFNMKTGEMSSVQVRDDQFEVYKVLDHRNPKTAEFQSVQKEIENKLLHDMKEKARETVLSELRSRGTVITIFDGETPAGKTSRL